MKFVIACKGWSLDNDIDENNKLYETWIKFLPNSIRFSLTALNDRNSDIEWNVFSRKGS